MKSIRPILLYCVLFAAACSPDPILPTSSSLDLVLDQSVRSGWRLTTLDEGVTLDRMVYAGELLVGVVETRHNLGTTDHIFDYHSGTGGLDSIAIRGQWQPKFGDMDTTYIGYYLFDNGRPVRKRWESFKTTYTDSGDWEEEYTYSGKRINKVVLQHYHTSTVREYRLIWEADRIDSLLIGHWVGFNFLVDSVLDFHYPDGLIEEIYLTFFNDAEPLQFGVNADTLRYSFNGQRVNQLRSDRFGFAETYQFDQEDRLSRISRPTFTGDPSYNYEEGSGNAHVLYLDLHWRAMYNLPLIAF